MKWYKFCSFCDYIHTDSERGPQQGHQAHCVWPKLLRATKWSENGVVIALDGRRAQLPTRE